jgi:formate dehydrogenase maturation protein FdhE
MGFLSIAERLKLLSSLSHNEAHAPIQQYLALHEKIYRAHDQFLKEHPTAVTDWMKQLSVPALETKARDAKASLIRFLDEHSFKPGTILTLQKMILALSIIDPAQNARYVNYHACVTNNHPAMIQLVTAVLHGDNPVIQSYADQFELDLSFFSFLLSSVLQLFIEALAQKTSSGFMETWWQSLCPICGRTPAVARIRKRRRYLMCAYCGAEYLSDHFLCVHCDNRDPSTLQYLDLDDKPAFRIDYCTKCHKYLKVINDDKIKETIPRFLEDILTLDLDLYAQHAGLTRDL